MSPVVRALQSYDDVDLLFIYTGQHFDYSMSLEFVRELKLPMPDESLDLRLEGIARISKLASWVGKVLTANRPDLVLVQGDTDTVLVTSLVAKKLGIPIGHVEAGLRNFDRAMPEEINRAAAAVFSELHFAPTEKAAINLIHEGVMPERIYLTGNTVVDACLQNIKIAERDSNVLERLGITGKDKIVTVTLHRAENVDSSRTLSRLVSCVTLPPKLGFTVVFPVHPRTKKMLKADRLWPRISNTDGIHAIEPLGYLDFLKVLHHSFAAITDSGGVQEEAMTLGVPCITLRKSTERPETLSGGGNILLRPDSSLIGRYLKGLLSRQQSNSKLNTQIDNPLGDGRAGQRIARICAAACRSGIRVSSPEFYHKGAPRFKLLSVRKDVRIRKGILLAYDKLGNPVLPRDGLVAKRGWHLVFLTSH